MDASFVLEDFFISSGIPSIIQRSDSHSLCFPLGWSTIRKISEGPALSIELSQKVQREMIYFTYVVRKNEKGP